jgi:phospholipase/carboxylesterase
MSADLSFIHRYQAGATPDAPTLLLLHGTGGDESDLLPLVPELLLGAGALSPRGKVLERGMPRFFRRLAEGVFDLDDLRVRTSELADFVIAASAHYRFDPAKVMAVGFSNGANIASSLLLLRPGVLAGGVLFRGMVPIVPETPERHPGTRVLISNGRSDPLVSAADTERLADLLRSTGADVTVAWQASGHTLTRGDLTIAREWLQRFATG